MQDKYIPTGKVKYFRAEEIERITFSNKTKRRKRLWRYEFKTQSPHLTDWGKPYTTTWEISINQPTLEDFLKGYRESKKPKRNRRRVRALIRINQTQFKRYLISEFDLPEFLSSPFSSMLSNEQIEDLKTIYRALEEYIDDTRCKLKQQFEESDKRIKFN